MCLYIRMAECVPLMFPIPSLPTRHVFIQKNVRMCAINAPPPPPSLQTTPCVYTKECQNVCH